MTADSPNHTENSPRQLWLTLAAMTLAGSMILVDQTAVPMAIVEIMDDLNGPLAIGQWVLTANSLPLAALLVLGGRLGDGFGLKRSFLIPGTIPIIVPGPLAGRLFDRIGGRWPLDVWVPHPGRVRRGRWRSA